MAEKLTPDICVIGAGSGGLSVAAAAAALRRAGGADRKGQDGWRLPEHRLRAFEGADCGRQARARSCHAQRRVRHRRRSAECRIRRACIDTSMASSRPSRRTIRSERFTGLGVHGDRGHRALHRTRRWSVGDEHRDQGAPLRDRDRLLARGAADPGPRHDALSHQRDDVRPDANARSICSSSAAGRSASNSRRRSAGSAPR